MIEAVIFDLNGVLIQSPHISDRFKEKFDVPVEKFLPVLNKIMAKVRKPKAGDFFIYWRPCLEKWGINLTREKFFDFYFNAEKEIPEMIELAKRIKKKGIKVFILSNNFRERVAYYKQKFSFLDEIFDKVYYSFQTGFVKPDPGAFKNLLTENNLKPKECIYFDNSKENIEVANNLGIKSFFFERAEITEKILGKNKIL